MFLTCHYYSSVLNRNTEINVIIPTPEGNEQIISEDKAQLYDYENGLKTVYLLHGAYGDCFSWIRFSSIERVLQAHRLIGVFASAENSFYHDMAHGSKYFTYMTEELPAYITRIFPASGKREDTFIAGLSMGGYGAWYLALSRPDLYAKTASMSGALDLLSLHQSSSANNPFVWSDIFGSEDMPKDSDLFYLYEKDQKKGILPKLYQSCGTADFLYQMNQDVHQRLSGTGADITYHEEEGAGHDWDYWDHEIRRVIEWLVKE